MAYHNVFHPKSEEELAEFIKFFFEEEKKIKIYECTECKSVYKTEITLCSYCQEKEDNNPQSKKESK